MGEKRYLLFVILAHLHYIYSIPVDSSLSIVGPLESKARRFTRDVLPVDEEPRILEMHVTTKVANRFANTIVRTKVKNFGLIAKETTFIVVLPTQAYISDFAMEIGGKNFTSHVEDKTTAQQNYDDAKASGLAAAQVAVSARDSNMFIVSMNIEPNTIAVFLLYYVELLERSDSIYELVLNIHPKQIVDDLKIEVTIEESRELTSIDTPQIRTGNVVIPETPDLDPEATFQLVASNKVIIVFQPSREKQILIAKALGTDQTLGISGQFVVQYDVQRDPNGGEVLIKDGYFVHFFAPANQKRLRKHVVFVLDTSGSMYGQRINQLKQAMKVIISDLAADDYFSIIEFNTYVKEHYFDSTTDLYKPYVANTINKNKAITTIQNFEANSMTNIYDALSYGLILIKSNSLKWQEDRVQPIIIFLTDGEATCGITDPKEIVSKISEENTLQVPIISVSFGDGPDRAFLETLSLNNFGFSRHIYEDSDASLQLEKFYLEVSAPNLRNVTFNYIEDVTSLTITENSLYYGGTEFIISGKIAANKFYSNPVVQGIGYNGPITFTTTVTKAVGELERLWAYQTVRKILEDKKKDATRADEYNQKALDLALKYKFVTEVTSMVVVKPDSVIAVNTVPANGPVSNSYGLSAIPSTPGPPKPPKQIPAVFRQMWGWLETNLRPDGSLIFLKGKFTLGFNETSPDNLPCTNYDDEVGSCKLIKDCFSFHASLKDKYAFVDNLCTIDNKFAGVCCL